MKTSRYFGARFALGAVGCLALVACGTTHLPAADEGGQYAAQVKPTQDAKGAYKLLTGAAAVQSDWRDDAPGLRRHITVADLPAPYATQSVDNGPPMIPRPEGAMPKAPAGFAVSVFAHLERPRKIITAPNGDLFVAESEAHPNRVHILRDTNGDGKPDVDQVFASDGLRQPFGLAFYPVGPNPQWLYVANTDSVVRFPYHNGDTKATGPPQTIVNDISGGGRLRGGGHWTRDLVFSPDGKKMYVSVGSRSNVQDNDGLIEVEKRRARIYQYNPDGTGERVYATGIRNPVGLAIQPGTGQLWTSVNERDGLGDNLVPDYVTSVKDGGFYGWPYYYMGGHPDKRAHGVPPLANTVLVPDVLLQSHSASLCMTFYTGHQFPKGYDGDAFAAEHGSWNRSRRTGYKVIRVLMKNGKPTGVYEDFLTGFITPEGRVWGRPVGVTVGHDGSLFVTDDGSGIVWRVQYTGGK